MSLTTEDDWIEAAYVELGEVGPEGVSVESVARRLGVSKAGFYHRFANRKELLDRVVHRWVEHSESMMAGATATDPIEQIVDAAHRSITDARMRNADTWLLLRTPTDSDHAELSHLIRQSIITWMHDLLFGLGLPPDEARTRATLIYFGYLGMTADLATGELELDDDGIRRHLEQLIGTLAGAPQRRHR